jgi:hypothetical protein
MDQKLSQTPLTNELPSYHLNQHAIWRAICTERGPGSFSAWPLVDGGWLVWWEDGGQNGIKWNVQLELSKD